LTAATRARLAAQAHPRPGLVGTSMRLSFSHLQEGRDAAHAGAIRHQVIGRAMADQVPMLGGAGQHLAGGDRDVVACSSDALAQGVLVEAG
jgi:hypothetical protein